MTRPDLRSERGFTMIAVLIVMTVATTVATAVLLAAQQDLPFSKASADRKQAYAAAEAGVEYYLYQLTNDNDYWTRCTNVPAPAPVNQRGVATRKWRTLSGTSANYTIELLPANGATCVEGQADTTMLNQATGTIKVRATGKAGKTQRSIVAEYRRDSFLDFLYFTDFETFSPEAYASDADREAAKACAKYRDFRMEDPGNSSAPCAQIRFISDDVNLGPFHTNDDILACGNYTLGRNAADKIEISGPNKWQHPGNVSSVCETGAPNVDGTLDFPAKQLPMPSTNAEVKNKAAAQYSYTGRTWIYLHDGVMDVTTWPLGVKTVKLNEPLPANGVISVRNGSCSSPQPPIRQSYNEVFGCANVTVWGTYTKSMTITSEKDIIVGTPVDPTNNTPLYSSADLKRGGDVVLGLIADKFVRVSHAVSRSSGCTNRNATNGPGTTDDAPMTAVTVEAAILSLQHSFMVDNHECGDELGTLSVTGAIAQRFRGPVGTTGGGGDRTGFLKNYKYDDRFRYRSPPFFLTPIKAAWNIMRENEQSPAARQDSPPGSP